MKALALRKELLALLRDGRVAALLGAAMLVMVAVAAVSGWQQQEQMRERAAVEEATRRQWDNQGDKHPHRGAHFGLYALRTMGPLSTFEPGLTPFTGAAIWLEPHRRNPPRFSAAADELPGARLARLSPGWVAAVLVPLLILGAVFASVTQERESGTLRMLHALSFQGSWLLAAKWLALLPALLLLLVATALPIAAAVGVTDFLRELAGATVLAVALLLYWLGFAALGIGVSARSKSSRSAFVGLLGIWFLVTLAMPPASAVFAQARVALPSADAFWSAIKRDYEQGLPGDGDLATRVKRFEARLLEQYKVNRVDDLPVGINPLRRLERDAYADRVHALHFDDLWARLESQQRIVDAAGVLSSTIALRGAASALAGTGLTHQRHFEESAEAYRREFNTSIDRWEASTTRGVTSFEDRFAGDSLWQSIPRFDYQPPGFQHDLRHAAVPLLLLAVWFVLAVAFMMRSARALAR